MPFDQERIRCAFAELIADARALELDFGREIESALQLARDRPLTREVALRMVSRALEIAKSASVGADGTLDFTRDMAALAREIVEPDSMSTLTLPELGEARVVLESRDGLVAGPVRPPPVFHGKLIPMNEGIVPTVKIRLWEENVRLDVHIQQFQKLYGRRPTPEELVQLMLSKMNLPGSRLDDEFEILELANSIAVNGVRVPPILSRDGRLLDGNRRVAACHLILSSDEYTPEQKVRAEYLYVHMLTEHATPDDEEAVVVAMNFEDDNKLGWPEYVKAHKIYKAWEAMRALEPRGIGPRRIAALKAQLARRFAMGTDTTYVNRYLKMMEWALAFEDYHINEMRRDPHEVAHRAAEHFQYFDELSKGARAGGVAHTLEQNESLRRVVFDLLYQGKFKTWRLIRSLKYAPDNPEVLDALIRQRDKQFTGRDDLAQIQDDVEDALAIPNARRAEVRQVGANQKIASFVKFLLDLPVGAFADYLTVESLEKLLDALKLVEPEVRLALERKDLKA